METVNKYLINEGKASSTIKKVVSMWQSDQLKLSKKFESAFKKALARIDDIEGLENFRDMEINNMAISPELDYALRDALDERIDKLWAAEMKVMDKLDK